MIRINLLPHKEARKRKSGQQQVVLFVLAFVVEIAALLFYMNHKESGLTEWIEKNKKIATGISGFKRDLAQQRNLELQKKTLLDRQKIQRVLEIPGPENVLLFLSYVLRPPEQISRTSAGVKNEMDDLRFIGWRVDWDPRNVYLSSLSEASRGTFRIEGTAKNLNDVAEFINRISDAPFFKDIKGERQTIISDRTLKLEYVKFTISCALDYSAAGAMK